VIGKIANELNRIKNKVAELNITSTWNTHIEKAIKADEELQIIYNKLKEVRNAICTK